MKKIIFFLFLAITFVSCAKSPQGLKPADQGFVSSFVSMNCELRGSLSRYDYNHDLSSLTYDDYLKHVSQNTEFNKLLGKIKSANDRYFSASKNYFIICLKYESEGYAVCDNSSTAIPDRIESSKPLPGFNEMIRSIQNISD